MRLIDLIYPVGHVMITVNPYYDPNKIFKTHSWIRFAQGKTLVGVDPSDADFKTAEKTGGEKKHTLTESEMPAHIGHLQYNEGMSGLGNSTRYLSETVLGTYGSSGRGWNSVNGGEIQPAGMTRGNNVAHNNMPPYITVYFWRRVG